MNTLTFDEVQIQKLFGHEAAEDEEIDRLKSYYFKTSTYDQVINDLPLRILVAHKGIGKSALFQMAIHEDSINNKLAILIRPDDVVEIAEDTSNFLKAIREWKVGLSEIISEKILQKYGDNSTEDMKENLKKYGWKTVEYLKNTFKNMSKLNIGPTYNLLINNFLEQGKINIYIDDLDRGWQGQKNDISRISTLLNAARDLAKENKGLQFRISLRSDVYYLVRTSDESTDKIEGSVIWLSWTNHEILCLLIKRIETFFNRDVNEDALLAMRQRTLSNYLNPIMASTFDGQGHWENAPIYRVLMSLIRKRPRDLVKLLTLSARNARGCKFAKIETINFKNSFEEYSQGRLQDTVNEFRSELPEIQRLLLNMKPNKREKTTGQGYIYDTAKLLGKLAQIQERGRFCFSNGREATTKDLAAFLYKINFLTARKESPTGIMRIYFEENRYLSSELAEFGFDWEVHPAYRWALQPDDKNIYSSLQLSNDEDKIEKEKSIVIPEEEIPRQRRRIVR